MYTQLRANLRPAANRSDKGGDKGERTGWRVSRNVVNLGLTSLFTDISSEMVNTILPLYLVFYLRTSLVQVGLVDGLYQGVTALVGLGAGALADRRGRYKEVALAGYGLSAVGKLGLLAVGSMFAPLAGVVVADRVGKGIRTAPRDTLISLSAPPDRLGSAFGVHRALDTVGALLGPLVAFGLLRFLPGRFDAIFMVSFCFAAVGVAILVLFVEGRRSEAAREGMRTSWRQAMTLLRRPRLMVLVAGSAVLGLATISDAFIYLLLQRRTGFNPGFLPLLYVATSATYLVLAIPLGRLADRVGRARVVVIGYVLLALAYVALLTSSGGAGLFVPCLLVLGAYYAATDGVMAALTSAATPAESRTTGLALHGTAVGLAQLGGSVCFGLLWTVAGADFAITVFLVVLLVGIAGLAAGLVRTSAR